MAGERFDAINDTLRRIQRTAGDAHDTTTVLNKKVRIFVSNGRTLPRPAEVINSKEFCAWAAAEGVRLDDQVIDIDLILREGQTATVTQQCRFAKDGFGKTVTPEFAALMERFGVRLCRKHKWVEVHATPELWTVVQGVCPSEFGLPYGAEVVVTQVMTVPKEAK